MPVTSPCAHATAGKATTPANRQDDSGVAIMERPISPFMFPTWHRFQITSALSILPHLCNGIRHLAWDASYGFEIRDAYRSGYAVLAATGGAASRLCSAPLTTGGGASTP